MFTTRAFEHFGKTQMPVMAVYGPDGLVILRSQEEYASMLRDYYLMARARGMEEVLVSVHDIVPVSEDRLKVRVDMTHVGRDNRHLGTSEINYFVRVGADSGFTLELIEILRFAGHALSTAKALTRQFH